MRRPLVGQQEQEIDIRERRHLAAAIAADRDDRDLLAGGRVGDRVDAFADEVEQDADQLVDQKALLGDAMRRAAAGLETPLDFAPPMVERLAQQRDDRGTVGA